MSQSAWDWKDSQDTGLLVLKPCPGQTGMCWSPYHREPGKVSKQLFQSLGTRDINERKSQKENWELSQEWNVVSIQREKGMWEFLPFWAFILISWGYHNKVPQNWVAENNGNPLAVLEGENLKSRCWQGHDLSESSRGKIHLASSSSCCFLATFSLPWLVGTSL